MFTNLAQILNFTSNPFALISLLAIIVNFSIVAFIYTKGSKNEANRWFTLLIAAIILWGFSEFFSRISASPETSLFWGYVGRPGWVFVPVIFFAFVLNYIGRNELLRNRFYQYAIFGPPLLFLFLTWNTNLISNNNLADTIKVPWGWDTVPVAPYFWIFIVWLEAFFLTSVALLVRHYFKITDEIRKKQTALITIAVLIPIVGGSLTDAIFPIFDIEVMPVAVLLTSVMSMIITYAIIRYSLFTINPQITAGTIIDTMSEALIVAGPHHTIEQVNKATLDLLGYKKSEIIGRDIRKILPDLESWDKFLKKVLIPLKKRTPVRGFEIDFKTNDGKRIPVSFSATSIFEKGRLQTIIGLARDVRETKKLINKLTAERNKMSVTVSGIADGVFAVDGDGKIILFNQAMARMLEIGSSEVIGKHADKVIKMFDEDEERLLISDLLPKETIFEDRVVVAKKNVKITKNRGGNIFANLTSSTIAENEDINLGAIISLHDISVEHDLEEMKLDFVSMAAHELRTPLTAIRGYLSVLQDELKGKVDNEKLSFLQKAFISSSQLASLVENLLSVSRIERGRMKIERTMIDWDGLLTEIVGNLHDQARQKGIKLVYTKPKSKLPGVKVDRFRIGEVVSNLVANAVNYTDPGGKVEVSVEVKGDEIVTHIEDTGQGIPKEALPKLFTKFFRVSGVLEQGSKGTGLGLYISKAIVEMHKGRIWVKSILGEGSTFSFTLPLNVKDDDLDIEGSDKEEKEKKNKKEEPGLASKRIFVKKGKKIPHLA